MNLDDKLRQYREQKRRNLDTMKNNQNPTFRNELAKQNQQLNIRMDDEKKEVSSIKTKSIKPKVGC